MRLKLVLMVILLVFGCTAPATARQADSTLVDRLLQTPISPELLSFFGELGAPELNEDWTDVGGRLAVVDIPTGFYRSSDQFRVDLSLIRYVVYAEPWRAEEYFLSIQAQYREWGYVELDLSPSGFGTLSTLWSDSKWPKSECFVVVENVLIQVQVQGGGETWQDMLNAYAMGNCEGAITHLVSLMY